MPVDRPAYAALADAVRVLVVDGRVSPGTRLPGERDLAASLGTSRTTTARAYAELVASGWATARRGSGTTVTLPGTGRIASTVLLPREDDVLDLTAAASVASPGTAALVARALEGLPAVLRTNGYSPLGAPRLRELVAARYAARGLPTDPDQIIVTPGALAAIAVVAHAVLGAGDRALVESPTYPNSLGALRGAGARVVGVPVGPDGWHPPTFAAALRQSAPRLAYLVPDFHNPTGMLMSAPQREAIAATLRANRTLAVVDECLVELDLAEGGASDAAPMPPPFGAFDAGDENTVSLGSLSKPLWGGVRVGWLRAPVGLRDRLLEARVSLELGSSALDQLVGVEFLTDPGPILAERRGELRATRDAWHAELGARLPDWRVPLPRGGLALWVELPQRLSGALTIAAERHGLALVPGARFTTDGTHAGRLRLPLTVPAAVVPDAVERLAAAYADALRRPDRAADGGPPLVA
ncbi:transcriptional regulator, GntR family with aminotransferase domain [Beutenbergia cavernae DSM 12333]|uniref:Transcriptional regulator, GntR family with aminotransferase domain n=2 Tax=Beutenbergia TaxID=84756 RepID=C5C525_BEUC1|nr:transcriptional regulator, GntR family with aminotransferase domain [Beutenbergia cavernae DSM 12333]